MRRTGERVVRLERLGRREYREVLALQRELQAARREGGADRLLLVEHDAVFTLGKAHPDPKLRVGAEVVAAAGIPVVQTERGGDITYHGPGQLVAYVILDLRGWGMGATDLVGGLERCAIAVLARWGIAAGTDARNRGVWASGRKIASIGINVRGGVSMHGIALNVDPELEHFALIDPCGLEGVEVTSMARELGREMRLADIEGDFVAAFAEVFDCGVDPEQGGSPVRGMEAPAGGGGDGSP